jgi:uncharacterized protein
VWHYFPITLFIASLYAWLIEPNRLVISERAVPVSEQAGGVVRLLFISDLHLGFWSMDWVMHRSITKLLKYHQQKPVDAIIFGGDYLDRSRAYLPRLSRLLDRFQDFSLPMYAVLGNHDYTAYADPSKLMRVMESKGIQVLRNSTAILKVRQAKVGLIGLDDLLQSKVYQPTSEYQKPESYLSRARQVEWLEEADDLPDRVPRVIICHNPDAVYLPSKQPIEAVISGHTHGGQFFFLKPFAHLLSRLLPPGSFSVWSGKKVISGTTLLVSRGIAGSLIPARLFCPPEALVVQLMPSLRKD